MSASTFVAVAVLAGLALTGVLLYLICPPPVAVDPDVVRAFLTAEPDLIRPEPHETSIYSGLLLATPLLLYGAAELARRLHLERAFGYLDLAIFLLFIAGCFALRPWETPFISELPRHALQAGPSWGLAAVVAAVACLFVELRFRSSLFLKWSAVAAIGALGVIFNLSWLVFGPAAVLNAPNFVAHWDAVLYSVVQMALGAVCLHDIAPQYGCYGEFLRPLLAVSGLSVSLVTLAFAAIQSVSTLAVIAFCFVTFRSTVLAAAASCSFIVVSNQITYVPAGHYFQYMPIRLLFPALSLWCFYAWSQRGSPTMAILLGFFSGVGLLWNLDSGAVVAVALGLAVVFVNVETTRVAFSARARLLALYSLGVLLAVFVAACYLSARAGAMISLSGLTYYQGIFFGSGFMMLPMPAAPDYWTIGAAVLAIVLSFYAASAALGIRSRSLERAAYLAILGAGLLSYYVGRSHQVVFLLSSWPVTILTFYLLDHYQAEFTRSGRSFAGPALRSTGAAAVVLAMAVVAGRFPYLQQIATQQWATVMRNDRSAPILEDAAFIAQRTLEAEPVAILAPNQGSLLAEARRRSIVNPGLMETLLRPDAEKLVAAISEKGPMHLFIDTTILSQDRQLYAFEPWVQRNYSRLTSRYKLAETGPGGRLLHLMRVETKR